MVEPLRNKRILFIFLLLAISILVLLPQSMALSASNSGTPISAAPVPGQDITLTGTGGGNFILTGTSGNQFTAILLDENGFLLDQIVLPADRVSFSSVDGGFFYAVLVSGGSGESSQTTVTRYRIGTNRFLDSDTLVFPKIACSSDSQFAADSNGNLYMIDSFSHSLSVFSKSGALVSSLSEKGFHLVHILSDFLYLSYLDGQLAVCPLAEFPDGLETTSFTWEYPWHSLSETSVIDSAGTVFSISGSDIFKLCSLPPLQTACFFDGSVLSKTDSFTATLFDLSGNPAFLYSFDGTLLSLATSGSLSAAVVFQNDMLCFLRIDQMTPDPVVPDIPDPPDPGRELITSSVYEIDRTQNLLILPSNTTVAVMRSGLELPENSELLVKKPNGSTQKSGVVGTGVLVNAVRDSSILDTLTVVVYGDVDGTGTVTSTDVRLLYDHLIQKTPLDGIFYTAADLDQNGTVETVDLVLLKKRLAS